MDDGYLRDMPSPPDEPRRHPLRTGLVLALGLALTNVPRVGSASALLAGVMLALIAGNAIPSSVRALSQKILPLAVVGLGAEMNLAAVIRTGIQGMGYTAVSLAFVMLAGLALSRVLKVERGSGFLISVGTAVCGGSAIAAVAPVIRAREHQVSVALGTVFLLNALALVVFPPIGHLTRLGQDAFGIWAALAIHDTSSVVGAGLAYGERALQVATTIKLARALWIVPLTLFAGLVAARRADGSNDKSAVAVKKPWFILGFLAMAALVTWVPALRIPGHFTALAARRAMVLSLFLIGTGLSRQALRSAGIRPLVQGLLLWLTVSALALTAVRLGLLVV
jgi:uncharacterized integral membrane protein (TIGR00698 family)